MPEKNNKTIFSKNLQYLMKQKKVSQLDLMKELHLPSATVSSWVNGTRMPRMEKIQMLATYFDVDISALLDDWLSDKKNLRFASYWSSLNQKERELYNKKMADKRKIEEQNNIINTILNLAETAGPDYLDYFIDGDIPNYEKCELFYNLFSSEVKTIIDLLNSSKISKK